MAVNDLNFNQLSTVLQAITQQATGQAVQAPVNSGEFVSVAQTALKSGYDPIINAVSQVLGRTISSVRPYNAKFGGMRVSEQRFGNIVRKLNIVDKPFEDDARFEALDGQTVDMYRVNAPEVLQTNFYGANVFEKSLTIYRDQLDNAFSSVDEFGRFVSMTMQNASDMIEQAHENLARATLGNFIGGKVVGDPDSVIHLLTEYNTLTGLNLTATTVYQPANFKPFMEWVYSRVADVSARMTERTTAYQINVTDKAVTRHTPLERQRVYMYAPARFQIEARVLADTYHDNYLRYADTETVNFWQTFDDPAKINVKPTYLKPDGTLETPAQAVEVDNIFGAIMDEEAAGYTVVNQWSAPTPFNAKGGYSNIFWHFTDRYWNDFTEKGVILCLD